MKRTNKIVKVKEGLIVPLNIGTTDKKNPSVFFINGALWVMPLFYDNYTKAVENIEKSFRQYISSALKMNDILNDKYILNMESTPNYMKYRKKTYINFELYLKQSNEKELMDFNSLKDGIMYIIYGMSSHLYDTVKDNGFDILS